MSKNDLGRARITNPGLRLSSISTLAFALAVLRSKVHTLARPLLWSPAPGELSWQPGGTQQLVVSEKGRRIPDITQQLCRVAFTADS